MHGLAHFIHRHQKNRDLLRPGKIVRRKLVGDRVAGQARDLVLPGRVWDAEIDRNGRCRC